MFQQLNSLMIQYHVWAILATITGVAFVVKLVLDGLKAKGVIPENAAGKWNIALNTVIGVAQFVFPFFSQGDLLTNMQQAADKVAPEITLVLVTILATKGVHELLKWVLGQKDEEVPPDAEEKAPSDAISSQALETGVSPGLSPGVTVQPMGFVPPPQSHLTVVQAHKRTGNEEQPELNYEELGDNGMPGTIAA